MTAQEIVDASIELIEREGSDALTMRRLGADLGVQAMSLYHHVPNREALLLAIGDALLSELDTLELEADWSAACRRFAEALRRIAVARPATFRLLGLQPLDTPRSLHAVERLLGVLTDAGFSVASALATYRAVASYARGYALAESAGFTVDAASAAGRTRLLDLPTRDFPILRGRLDELEALDTDTGFEHGLTALLAGLAATGAPA